MCKQNESNGYLNALINSTKCIKKYQKEPWLMCLRIVSTKCVNRMKARAIRPLCWPLLTNSFQLDKVCGYKGGEITLTTFLTLLLQTKYSLQKRQIWFTASEKFIFNWRERKQHSWHSLAPFVWCPHLNISWTKCAFK